LRNNVTIPRKADEIKKIFKGLSVMGCLIVAPHHLKTLEMIDDCYLYNHIFTLSKRDSTTDPTTTKKKTHISIGGVLDPPHPPAESVAAGRLVNYIQQHRIAEFLQLNTVHPNLPWIMAGLAPWRGAVHPHPPKKEAKFLASLITKHELMYGEEIRDVVDDTFEKGKMDIVKEAAEKNELEDISRRDAGMSSCSFS
jgi:hypothetical protein